MLVGDSAIDLRTARAAGIRMCLVKYGFGFPVAAAELRGDELLIATPGEFAGILR